jgi:FAD-linked oxidoreductase
MRWSNWSGSVKAKPAGILYPDSVEEIQRLVQYASRDGVTFRTLGSGHSFTPLVSTDHIIISLNKLHGIGEFSANDKWASVKAGTKLKSLGKELYNLGLSQKNLGDINVQSIAGAISTGTHGTGISLGSISTQVSEIRFVNGKAELVTCSETENQELFKAAKVSLGSLGIITEVKLELEKQYNLHLECRRLTLKDCLNNLEDYIRNNRHFEFFWIPYTGVVLAKFLNITDKQPEGKFWKNFNELFIENGMLKMISEYCRLFPSQSRNVCHLMARFISDSQTISASHEVFSTPRLVKFQEMEYNLPLGKFRETLLSLERMIVDKKVEVNFPVECRFVRSDDIWLSPAYQRESAYIAVHMYKGMPYQDYFRAAEDIFIKSEGRPHWGKMHFQDSGYFENIYPKWSEFQKIREENDPQGIFINEYLEKVFGIQNQQMNP